MHYLPWLAVVAIALVRPAIAAPALRRLEKLFGKAARGRTVAWIGIGLLALFLRGALLPFWPEPKPVIYDEFGYLLQADTFAHGRLANPTHRLSDFFESPYILQRPTYAAKYPPAQGLAMAAGQVIFGDPWFGVWLSSAAMLSALVWALQGWLPPGWALLGGLIALPLTISTYWMDSFWGGAVAAIGGALVLGGYARIARQNKSAHILTVALGLAILANSRPYEGLVFSIPVIIAFVRLRPGWKAVALSMVILLPAAFATGYYNYRVTGNALQMPFTEYAKQYARIPLFSFQPLSHVSAWPTTVMRDLHENWERKQWEESRTWKLIPARLQDWRTSIVLIFGNTIFVLPMLAFLPAMFRDRRIRLPLVCLLAVLAGSLMEIRCYPHYLAPAVPAALIVLLQSLRHLRYWKPAGRPAGRFLAAALPIVTLALAISSRGMILIRQVPPENSQPPNARRAQVEDELADKAGQHVILVRYTGSNSPHEEWVYNGADIDSQDIVWAHDLGPEKNHQLLDYYKDRHIWLLKPDVDLLHLDLYR